MSIAQVVTRGYGNGTYAGQIRQVVVRGYFSSISVPVQLDQLPNIAVQANSGSHTFALAPLFAGETSFSIAGNDAGITLNTGTGVLTVDSDVATAGVHGPITVTATNAAGSTAGNTFTVNVSTASISPYGASFNFSFRMGF